MELSEDQLKTLKRLASNYFSHKECCLVLDIDNVKFFNEMKNPTSVIYRTYYGAYYMALLKLRESISDLAMRGSGPAQMQLIMIIEATASANR